MSNARRSKSQRSQMKRTVDSCIQNRLLLTTLVLVFVVANITVAVSYNKYADSGHFGAFLRASLGDTTQGYDASDTYEGLDHSFRHDQSIKYKSKRNRETNIGFLKVHKSGSSTISNILFRFGIRHNLTFALPRTGNRLEARELAFPLRRRGPYYNIIAVHTVYSETLYNSILPTGAKKIAIVREPLQRTISAAYYYRDMFDMKYLMKIPRHKFINMLIRYPERFERERGFSLTKNAMAKDFGFSEYLTHSNYSIMQEYLDYLNETFSLVLVMESFDESVVLLRRIMNWSVQDVIYLKANSYAHKDSNVTENDKLKFRHTCFMDYAIYDYFTAEFQRKLDQRSTDFNKEVHRFKIILDDVRTFCDSESDALVVPASKWSEKFYVTRTDCKNMERSVLNMIALMKKRHRSLKH